MAELAQFKDSWDEDDENIEWWFEIKEKNPRLYLYLKDVDDYANKSTQVYLTMMAVRMLEMHRVLKPTGSLYYHCDQTAGHYIKVMLDIIFGIKNFRNEISWERIKGAGKRSQYEIKNYGNSTDAILFYTKTQNYTFRGDAIKLPFSKEYIEKKYNHIDNKGRYQRRSPFRPIGLGARPNLCYTYKGFVNPNPSGWTVSKNRLEEIDKEGDLEIIGDNKIYRTLRPEKTIGIPINNFWGDVSQVMGKQKTGYPTQKPLQLLERIIKASSNKGDFVLDPFCGCATTCVAAEKLERQWVGIDVWEDAHNIIQKRLFIDFDLWEGGIIHHLTRPPTRTDIDLNEKQTRKRKYITDEIKEQVWERDRGECRNCGARENLQYDHVIPHSKGGSDEIDNLQVLCRSCNLEKSNKHHS